ncbi:germ cell nuclear acidic protein-like [Microplitis mediator]|uniref:germ cell nuclear acidic protein-like n=1 Tax=Microplitis mediator TaxID=375433 RepID=UPI0025547533|nr:germ cell nuclear acidic protein-like [Microplitis mediator]
MRFLIILATLALAAAFPSSDNFGIQNSKDVAYTMDAESTDDDIVEDNEINNTDDLSNDAIDIPKESADDSNDAIDIPKESADDSNDLDDIPKDLADDSNDSDDIPKNLDDDSNDIPKDLDNDSNDISKDSDDELNDSNDGFKDLDNILKDLDDKINDGSNDSTEPNPAIEDEHTTESVKPTNTGLCTQVGNIAKPGSCGFIMCAPAAGRNKFIEYWTPCPRDTCFDPETNRCEWS